LPAAVRRLEDLVARSGRSDLRAALVRARRLGQRLGERTSGVWTEDHDRITIDPARQCVRRRLLDIHVRAKLARPRAVGESGDGRQNRLAPPDSRQ
jgi:hypothetical protein